MRRLRFEQEAVRWKFQRSAYRAPRPERRVARFSLPLFRLLRRPAAREFYINLSYGKPRDIDLRLRDAPPRFEGMPSCDGHQFDPCIPHHAVLAAILADSNSLSMVISPTLDFSRAISSSRSSRSRSFSADAAPASARSRHSVSLATETFVSRVTTSKGSPRNKRATTAILRWTE